MSQHILKYAVNSKHGEFEKNLVMMFGWDTALSQLYAQYHIEKPQEDENGDIHFEAESDSLREKLLVIKPSAIRLNESKVLDLVIDNVQGIVADTGIPISSKLLINIDKICRRMIEDATMEEHRLRVIVYEIK